MSEHHQLRDKLQAKQEELRSLQNGSAHQLRWHNTFCCVCVMTEVSDIRELERVKEVVEELQKQQVELSALREKDQQTVEGLPSLTPTHGPITFSLTDQLTHSTLLCTWL